MKAIPTLKWLMAPQQQPASMDPQVDARGRQRLEARRLAGAERASFRQWRSSKALLRLEQLAARDEYAPYLIDAIEHVSLGDLGVAVIEHGAHTKKAPCTHGEAIAPLTDYERERLANIARNEAHLAHLGLGRARGRGGSASGGGASSSDDARSSLGSVASAAPSDPPGDSPAPLPPLAGEDEAWEDRVARHRPRKQPRRW